MTVWIAFAAGIFVGWVIEWIIDWLYWRRNLAGFYATETQLRNELAASQARQAELNAENEALRAQLALVTEETPSVTQTGDEDEVGDEVEVTAAEATDTEADGGEEVEEVAVEPAETPEAAAAVAVEEAAAATEEAAVNESSTDAGDAADAPAVDVQPDNLTQISGIGPVYRRKLHEAGVKTFAQLAALTPEELTAIIQPADYQKPAFEQWTADAERLAAQPAGDDAPAASTDEEG